MKVRKGSKKSKHPELQTAIRNFRKFRGMTQSTLSKKSGVSQSHIANFEKGHTSMTTDKIDSLANALGAPLVVIFWKSITEEMIPDHKKQAFRFMKGSLDAVFEELYKEEFKI